MQIARRNCQSAVTYTAHNPGNFAGDSLGLQVATGLNTMRRRFFLLAVVLGVAAGCAVAPAPVAPPEPLYFAIELERDGQHVGSPKLLGFEGKQVVAERVQPGSDEPVYRLVVKPVEKGAGYRVVLELSLPGEHEVLELDLLHGEERAVVMKRGLAMRFLLMRVNSPEFKALMRLGTPVARGTI
jgi:hypothetical protein